MPAYSRRLESRSASQVYPNQSVLHDNGGNKCFHQPNPACYTPSDNLEHANAQGNETAADGDLLRSRLVCRYPSQDVVLAV